MDNTEAGVLSKYSVTFEYDAKNTFHNIAGYNKLLDYIESISPYNCILSTVITSIDKKGQILTSANYYKSTFKYDSKGYHMKWFRKNLFSAMRLQIMLSHCYTIDKSQVIKNYT